MAAKVNIYYVIARLRILLKVLLFNKQVPSLQKFETKICSFAEKKNASEG